MRLVELSAPQTLIRRELDSKNVRLTIGVFFTFDPDTNEQTNYFFSYDPLYSRENKSSFSIGRLSSQWAARITNPTCDSASSPPITYSKVGSKG
jgi:hypothetical protein